MESTTPLLPLPLDILQQIQQQPPPQPPAQPTSPQTTHPTKTPKLEVSDTLKYMLSRRDVSTEQFLQQLVSSLETSPQASADETGRQWSDEAMQKLSDVSVTLSHRVTPLLQHMLHQKLNQTLNQSFVTLEPIQELALCMARKYRACFNAWVDAEDCVSFTTHNTTMLGQLSEKEVFILTLFAFATCRHVKGDNLLCLGVTGVSTCGKSTIFENPLSQGAHTMTSDMGVGRFNVGQKNLLFLHDIELKTLVASADTDKYKTISRTEPTVAKVHSSTVCLPPLFLLYTCNNHLMHHQFPPRKGQFLSSSYPSQVQDPRGTRRESIMALQNRFLEAFCRKPPPLDPQSRPRTGTFQRLHLVVGIYPRVLSILESHQRSDFFSPTLALYALMGLASNVEEVCRLEAEDHRPRLQTLIGPYFPDQDGLLALLGQPKCGI